VTQLVQHHDGEEENDEEQQVAQAGHHEDAGDQRQGDDQLPDLARTGVLLRLRGGNAGLGRIRCGKRRGA